MKAAVFETERDETGANQEADPESGGVVPSLVISGAAEQVSGDASLMGTHVPSRLFPGSAAPLLRRQCQKSRLCLGALFSAFAAFVLCLNDVSDQLQSADFLTAFLHQSAFFRSFFLPFSRRSRRLWRCCCNYAFTSRFHPSGGGFKELGFVSIMDLLAAFE